MKAPLRTTKTARELRADAVRLARIAASEREKDGDPEGAGVIRDLAASISKIKLLKIREPNNAL